MKIPVVKTINDVKRLIREHHLSPGDQSENRRLLEEGVSLRQQRIAYNTMLNNNLNVDDMKGWIYYFVRDKLGGQLRGIDIVWELPNKIIVFEPLDGRVYETREHKG